MLSRFEALLILNACQKEITWSVYQNLITAFDSPENILEQKPDDIAHFSSKKAASSIFSWQEKFNLKKEIQLIEKNKIQIFDYEHSLYPNSLRLIPDPPILLYFKGNKLPDKEKNIGIVGSRQATIYGTKTTLTLAQQIAQFGWTVISGLAWGIDTHAHKGALLGNGKTIAVIGQGLNTPLFPADNEKLAGQICEQGGIYSEFPMNFAPVPRNFPQRNRIISGLSAGVLVVEAAKRSGAFITADFALEQGKPVLAVPGPIDSKVSEGPNKLIQQGAKCVLEVSDILEELASTPTRLIPPLDLPNINEDSSFSQSPLGLTPAEEKVWKELSKDRLQLEQLIDNTGLTVNEAALTLFSLEIKNLVKQLPGQYYVKL